MNYFDLYSSYPDRTIAAAWDSQVKDADKTPWLAGTITEYGDELFGRFAACYAELRALPRSARRALQRQLARSSELAAIFPEYLQQGGRRLQHRMAWSLAGAALLLALGQGVATAATMTVTTNDPRIIPDGQCSLVEAIVNANNDAATHADCPPGSGADTIVLPANANVMLSNVYCGNTSGPVCFAIGLPPITSRITIEGNGAVIHRQGNAPAFGLVAVRNSGDLTLHNLTLTGGGFFGGLLNSGTANIKNSIISGNTGGGVDNGATLTIANSSISNNSGSGVSSGGTLTIENSTISGNTGGGVSNHGTASIANSTISGNTSNYSGGGVFNSATLAIQNSSISSNMSRFSGGGVYNSRRSNPGGSLTITNSTISDNRAGRGGGVFNSEYSQRCYTYTYFGSPFVYCFYGITLTLNGSLVTGNQATIGPEMENLGVVNANNFNLFGSNGNAGVSGFTPGPTDIVPGVSLAQILGPLTFNGGPTQTHALVAGSPATDAGDPGGCRDNSGALLLKDQRGFTRHVDGNSDGAVRCDIGAVEFGAGSATAVDFDGDGLSDIGVYRNGIWFIRRSLDGGTASAGWGGLPQDRPVPGDYDGDGKADIAVYRDGTWFIIQSSDGAQISVGWGGGAQDIALPADYDGDGKTDIAVYRDGIWFIIRSSDAGVTAIGWGGLPQDIPVPADFDGDGKVDVAVYRDGTWFILRSSDGGQTTVGWGGVLADLPVPADYDGDGRADIAVYRNGTWFILRSFDGGQTTVGWGGLPQDIPVPADFDGDGKVDVAVYRNGMWFIAGSSGVQTTVGWGGAVQDIPLN
jgi:Right handed beta helix region/FG-GAP-like repeat